MTKFNDIVKEFSDGMERDIFIVHSAVFTTMSVLGDLDDAEVLDFGCGEGRLSRLMAIAGAKITGFDLAPNMIQQAVDIERQKPLGIRYFVANALDLPVAGQFDVVLANFVIHLSQTRAEMMQMIDSIHQNLKVGGRMIIVAPNHNLHPVLTHNITIEGQEPLKEGDPIRVTLYIDGKPYSSFVNYFWRFETYEEVARQIGFYDIRWHLPKVSPEGLKLFGRDFWDDYTSCRMWQVMEAFKGEKDDG